MLDTVRQTSENIIVGNNHQFRPSQEKKSESPVELICDLCPGPVIEYAKPSDLKAKGWEWGSFGAFCPRHN